MFVVAIEPNSNPLKFVSATSGDTHDLQWAKLYPTLTAANRKVRRMAGVNAVPLPVRIRNGKRSFLAT